MGRHGGAQRRRRSAGISLPLIAIGVLVVAAIGFGVWLWSLKSVTDPIDAKPVDAYAVVVSSPSCTSGAGTTIIDVSLTPAVRSSLSACGRRVGERLAVQYLDGHPDQVRLAGTTVAHNSPAGRWLPIAIVAAGLLAVIGTIALLRERRQSRHAGTAARVTVAQLRAGGVAGAPTGFTPGATGPSAGGVVGSSGAVPVPSAFVTSAVGESGSATSRRRAQSNGAAPSAPASPEPLGENPDATSRIAIPGFPGPAARPFRPSEIAVEEDLFTHRGMQAPDR